MTCVRSCQQIVLFLVFLLVFFQIESAFAEEKNISAEAGLAGISFKAGHLMVSVKDQEFSAVMDEVAKKAGLKISLTFPDDEKLTIDFDYVPLKKGLKKLLWGKDYVLINHADDDIMSESSEPMLEVIVLGNLTGRVINKAMKQDVEKQIVIDLEPIDVVNEIKQKKNQEINVLHTLFQKKGFSKYLESTNAVIEIEDAKNGLEKKLLNFKMQFDQQVL